MYFKALLTFVLLLVQAWTLIRVTSSSILLNNYTDLQSLIAFKSAIKVDPNYVLASNWTSDTNFCNWHGVTCGKRRQRVTALRLSGMGLTGPISPHIGNLSFLSVLDLMNNSFHGQVIEELGHLSRLKLLSLGFNHLTGEIPMSLPLCLKLQIFDLISNELTGTIPKNLTTLPQLQGLYLAGNNLTGTIPASFGNMSTLQTISFQLNKFHGTILNEVALLPRITVLYLGNNHFSGTIPPSLFNISSLKKLDLSYNSFTGGLPRGTDLQLPNLTKFFIGGNQFTGSLPSPWYNMSRLTLLAFESNNFTGTLPESFPPSLQILSAHGCNLQGEISKGIGTLKNLSFLDLSQNMLRATIPSTIKGMKSMQQLYVSINELEGRIPDEICSWSKVGNLYLDNNRFSGSIPNCIGNLSNLQYLILDSNALSSTIPLSLWSLGNLIQLSLSSNFLRGNIGHNFMKMKSLNALELSHNQLSGVIPDFSGYFQGLTILNLSWNFLSGPKPESFGKLLTLVDLDLSYNNLSGHIPKSLEAISYLKNLNLSYNKLSGEIPSGGPFVNFKPQSFIENLELCGMSISKPCPSHPLRKSRNRLFPLSYTTPVIAVVVVISVVFYVCRKRSTNNLHQTSNNPTHGQRMISYHELSQATNGFCEANFLGAGSFGHVYKGIMPDGEIVAVKLLNLTIDGVIKSFDAECKVLRTVRHRNLVKVISSCTNPDLRALVLEYIPNGSLEKWLYSHNYCLDFLQRVSIMLDVAVALDYLHCGQMEPVIHCDLKPSNVLLDEDMVAHVADFGIAKILSANKAETQTSTLGTIGYISPEYGGEGRVSTKGDTYSYGIMLLETFTRKKPTDEMFSESLSLRQWVSASVSRNIVDVVDENLFNTDPQAKSVQRHLLAVLDLGLGCCRDLPEERIELEGVVSKLNKIKLQIESE